MSLSRRTHGFGCQAVKGWTSVAALVWLAFAPGVAAQAPAGSGTVSGAVTTADGTFLPGVEVVALADGAVVARVVSGDYGTFRISVLKAGRYDLRAELTGFRPETVPLEIVAGEVTRVDVTLSLASISEAITVVGTAPRGSIEAPKVAESGARDVGEAMANLAGVWKVRRGAIASDVVLRGYQGENLTVLIDGMRLYGACPNNMDHTAFHVDFSEVDRIEVGKGPFDSRNQGALGGVVNIVTKRPGRGFHASPQLTAGSYGYLNPSATVSVGGSSLAGLAGYSYRESDVYTDGAGRSMLAGSNYRASAADQNAFQVSTAWGRVDASPSSRDRLLVTFTGQRAGTVLYPYLQMDAIWDDADRLKVGWDTWRSIGPVETLRVEAYGTRVRHWMTDEHRVSSATAAAGYSMGTLARTDSGGFKAEAVMGRVTVGADGYQRRWSSDTALAGEGYRVQHTIPDVNLTAVGLYGEYSLPIADALRLDVGGRADRTSSAADESKASLSLYRAYHGTTATSSKEFLPSGKARLSWRLGSDITVSGGIGRSVRVPDPQERYFGLRRMGTDWVGNPLLQATGNTGLDVALSARKSRAYITASVHHDALDDFIAVYQQPRTSMVPGVMNAAARSFRNVDATMTGAEVEGLVSLTDRLFLSGDVSIVRGRQRPNAQAGIVAGNLPEIPPARSRLAVRYDRRTERHGFYAEVEGIYSAQQSHVSADLKERPTPAYGLLNIRGGATTRLLRLTFGIGNVLNTTYFEHLSYQRDPFRLGVKVYEPGRNVYGGLTITF